MSKTVNELYKSLSEEFIRKGIASNRFSELEELHTWASIGENANSEYEKIQSQAAQLKELTEALEQISTCDHSGKCRLCTGLANEALEKAR